MLYLNSIENAEASPTERKYAICHDEVPLMLNIPELAPSRELLAQWQSNTIDWEEFRERFTDEMRAEYRREESRLRGLITYTLESDVTLHSPEPSGEQTYRAILEGIINAILADTGQTDRVINLARGPIEEAQPQEDIADLFGNVLHDLNLTRSDNTRLLIENAELKRDIQSFETEIHNTGTENNDLKKRIDQLEEKINTHETTIDDLRRTLSEKDGQIQDFQTESYKKDRKNVELKRQVNQLEEKISTKEGEVKRLKAESCDKDRKNEKLRQQVNQFQDINLHPRIRDIAVKATGNDPAFAEYFGTLDIDQNLPVELRRWLENLLIPVVDTLGNMGFERLDLNRAINQYSDFERGDELLAHVIRTQGNLSVHPGIDERTRMGRALCCFFAAALLSPKLPELE